MKVTPQTHLTKANKDIINFCFDNKTEYAQTKGNKYEVKKINVVERIDQLNEAVKSLGVERTLEIWKLTKKRKFIFLNIMEEDNIFISINQMNE